MFLITDYLDNEENMISAKLLTKSLRNDHEYEDLTNDYILTKSMSKQ
jgi:hypothetical protein